MPTGPISRMVTRFDPVARYQQDHASAKAPRQARNTTPAIPPNRSTQCVAVLNPSTTHHPMRCVAVELVTTTARLREKAAERVKPTAEQVKTADLLVRTTVEDGKTAYLLGLERGNSRPNHCAIPRKTAMLAIATIAECQNSRVLTLDPQPFEQTMTKKAAVAMNSGCFGVVRLRGLNA